MTEATSTKRWNFQLRGEFLKFQDEPLYSAGLGAGFREEMSNWVSTDYLLSGHVSTNRQLIGPMLRFGLHPLKLFDLAVTTEISGGLQGSDLTLRAGVGAEAGTNILIGNKTLRIFVGAESGFVTAGRKLDYGFFGGVALQIPFQAKPEIRPAVVEEKFSVPEKFKDPPPAELVAEPDIPVIERKLKTNPSQLSPEEKKVLINFYRKRSKEMEEKAKYDGAYMFESKLLKVDPSLSHERLLYLTMMCNYVQHENISREGLYAIRDTLPILIKRGHILDMIGGVRAFVSKTGKGLSDIPEKSNINVLIVIADLMELVSSKKVLEAGIVDRATVLALAQDRYVFSKHTKKDRTHVLPKVSDGVVWFLALYAAYMNLDVKFTKDAFNDLDVDASLVLGDFAKDRSKFLVPEPSKRRTKR